VVFADIDRDLSAPRLTAAREVLALITRAARLVGANGRLIIQSRQPSHPLLQALVSENPQQALMQWMDNDLSQRKLFSMPPFASMVRISAVAPKSIDDVPSMPGIDIARDENSVILKSLDAEILSVGVAQLRAQFGTSLRVHADPKRY
jgi:hypothetical protein